MKKRILTICAILSPGVLIISMATAILAKAFAGQFLVHLPMVIRPADTAAPTQLASGQVHPDSLVVDSQNVYWADCGNESGDPADGAIMVHSKSQGTTQPLVSSLACPDHLLADVDSLYWINRKWIPGLGEFTIFRLPKSGGLPLELASYQHVNGSLALDETYVYWRDYASGAIMRLPKTGAGSPEPAPVPSLVFNGTDAYWLDGGDLVRSGKDGSSAVTLVRNSDLQSMGGRPYSVVSIKDVFPRPSGIYFTVFVDNNPGWLSCTDQSTILMRMPGSGGAYVHAAVAAGRAAFFVTEPFAYVSGDCTPGVRKLNLDTQPAETLATWGGTADAMADDPGFVYWADYANGLIMRVVK
jgi:hypothetical protein